MRGRRGRTERVERIEQVMDQLVSEGADRIVGKPEDLERLIGEGLAVEHDPAKTLEETIDTLYELRKRGAVGRAGNLPNPPNLAAPSVSTLYNEIRDCIIFGLNGAAITLAGILVEYSLKFTTRVKEMGGYANYDPEIWDQFESITLARAITRAKKAGLIDEEEETDLVSFKDTVRNPYNHYNIRKITSNVVAGKVKMMNLETGEVEEKDIAARDDPVIQAQAKPYVDAQFVDRVFVFADATVKLLFGRISHLR